MWQWKKERNKEKGPGGISKSLVAAILISLRAGTWSYSLSLYNWTMNNEKVCGEQETEHN